MNVRDTKFRCLTCNSCDFQTSTTQWRCLDCARVYSCASGIPRLFSEDALGDQDRKLRASLYDGVFGRFYQFMMPFIVMPVRPLAISWPHWLAFTVFVVGLLALAIAASIALVMGHFGVAVVLVGILAAFGLLLSRERYLLSLVLLAVPTKISLLSRDFRPEETFTAVHDRVLTGAKAQGHTLRVLDVSTGSCNSLYRHGWMELDAEYTAIDLSNTMLQQGSEFMSAHGVPVDMVLGDAMNLPFRSDYFDIVLSYGAVNGLTDPVKAIAEMARVAKPGATLLFLDEQLYEGATAVERAYFHHVLSSHNVIHNCPTDRLPQELVDVQVSQVYHFYYICTARKRSI